MFLPEGFATIPLLKNRLLHIIRMKVLRSNYLQDDGDSRDVRLNVQAATHQMLNLIHYDGKMTDGFRSFPQYPQDSSGIFGLYSPKFGFVRLQAPKFISFTGLRDSHPPYWIYPYKIGPFQERNLPWEDILSKDYWIKNILERAPDAPKRRPELGGSFFDNSSHEFMIDHGWVRLGNLRKRIIALEAGIDFHAKCESADYDVMGHRLQKYFSFTAENDLGLLKSRLLALEPYEANPIMLHNEDFLRVVGKLVALDPNNEVVEEEEMERDYVTRIIECKRNDPTMPKTDVRSIVGTNISIRRFNLYWSTADEKAPELGMTMPGRKSLS